jgi:hypothetical protein
VINFLCSIFLKKKIVFYTKIIREYFSRKKKSKSLKCNVCGIAWPNKSSCQRKYNITLHFKWKCCLGFRPMDKFLLTKFRKNLTFFFFLGTRLLTYLVNPCGVTPTWIIKFLRTLPCIVFLLFMSSLIISDLKSIYLVSTVKTWFSARVKLFDSIIFLLS